MIDDLETEFLSEFSVDHDRVDVGKYPHYFLGTIITIEEKGQKYVIDGQQRLTTLTLLLIYLRHRLTDEDDIAVCLPLIYSSRHGKKSFNINIEERIECMQALYEDETFDASGYLDQSIANLVGRYSDIQDLFPEKLKSDSLPYFFDWLIENVDLVEIEANTDDAAFTIFETMNDRGVNLRQSEMLKGYLLANINAGDELTIYERKKRGNDAWKQRMLELSEIESQSNSKDEDESFIKSWLRGKYAVTSLQRDKGTSTQDFEKVNQFHRWVRDNRERLGLSKSHKYFEFLTRNFDFFAEHYILMRKASLNLNQGLEAIYYNSYNNLNLQLQYMLALAPLRLDDSEEIAKNKIAHVMTFLDIFVARNMVNFRRISYSYIWHSFFELAKQIRDKDVSEVRTILISYLSDMKDHFGSVTRGGYYGPFHMNQFTRKCVRYLLARMTSWVEQQCGMTTDFLTYTSRRGNSIEIEHLWANKYERHKDEFDSEDEFQTQRHYFGGLVLLPRGTNQSLGAEYYCDKAEHYVKENLLAASLHPMTYEKNPNFTNFVERSGLPFKPHAQFKKADLLERQELYRQICEQIWNPDRLLETS